MDLLAQSSGEGLIKIIVLLFGIFLIFVLGAGIYQRSQAALSFLSVVLLVFGTGLIIYGASQNSFLSDGRGDYYGMIIIAGGIVIHAAIQLILGLKNSKDPDDDSSHQDEP